MQAGESTGAIRSTWTRIARFAGYLGRWPPHAGRAAADRPHLLARDLLARGTPPRVAL